MTDANDANIDRRAFLRKSAVGSLGIAGLSATATRATASTQDGDGQGGDEQDEPSRPRYGRRLAFRYPERLNSQLRRKIVLMTDRTDDDPDVSEIDTCEFSNWPTDDINIWEGIIIEWDGAIGGFFGTNPDVRAEQLVQRKKIFVDDQQTPIELGTPYVINSITTCPGDYVGVTAIKIPGIDIKTGPDVSASRSPEGVDGS